VSNQQQRCHIMLRPVADLESEILVGEAGFEPATPWPQPQPHGLSGPVESGRAGSVFGPMVCPSQLLPVIQPRPGASVSNL
jgi:hypothetical protein